MAEEKKFTRAFLSDIERDAFRWQIRNTLINNRIDFLIKKDIREIDITIDKIMENFDGERPLTDKTMKIFDKMTGRIPFGEFGEEFGKQMRKEKLDRESMQRIRNMENVKGKVRATTNFIKLMVVLGFVATPTIGRLIQNVGKYLKKKIPWENVIGFLPTKLPPAKGGGDLRPDPEGALDRTDFELQDEREDEDPPPDPPDDDDPEGGGDPGDDFPEDPEDPEDPDDPNNLNDWFNSSRFKGIFNYMVKLLSFYLGNFPLKKTALIAAIGREAELAGLQFYKALMRGDITNPKNLAEELFKILFDGSYGIGQEKELEAFTKMLNNINYENFTPEQIKELKESQPTMELHVPGYTYAGPRTNFEKRVKGDFKNVMPVNKLDYLTMRHDMYYQLKDPLAHIYSDELLLRDLSERIFTNVPITQRILMLSMYSIFTIKNGIERTDARKKSFGGMFELTKGLKGDAKYLANDVIGDKFERIEKNWKNFETIMDDAGWSFTGRGDQLKFRKPSTGASERGKKLYKDFLKDTEFLFKYPPPRDIKTNFTNEELRKANDFVRTNMSNFDVLPQEKLDEDIGSVVMTNQSDFEKFSNDTNITKEMGSIKKYTKNQISNILREASFSGENIPMDVLEQIGNTGTIGQMKSALKSLKIRDYSKYTRIAELRKFYKTEIQNKGKSFIKPPTTQPPTTQPPTTQPPTTQPPTTQPNFSNDTNITKDMGLLDNKKDVLKIISDLKSGNNTIAKETLDNIIRIGLSNPNSTENTILKTIINDRKSTLKILRPIAKKMRIKGRISAMNKTSLRGIMNKTVTTASTTLEEGSPTEKTPLDDTDQTTPSVVPTPVPKAPQPAPAPAPAQPPTFEKVKDFFGFGGDGGAGAPPPPEAPEAPTGGSGASDEAINKLTTGIENLIKVIAVDTSGITNTMGGPNADISEDIGAFEPYLGATVDNSDSNKTLKEDVIVSKEEQKEAMVSYGIYDYVPTSLFNEVGNTFDQDRIMKNKLHFMAPLVVGNTNNSKLPWPKPAPSTFKVGEYIEKRREQANDALYTVNQQPARLKQYRDFTDLQSQREFYASRSYNPTLYAGGFNSFRVYG